MALFFTDFSEYTGQPSDWTEQWETIKASSDVGSDASMVGGVRLRQVMIADGYYACSWDALGTMADGEWLQRIVPRTNVDHVCRIYARGSGTSGARTGYFAYFHVSTGTIGIHKYVSGVSTSITSTTGTFSVNTPYLARFQVIGTSLKYKVWEEGTAEPGWTLEGTDSDISSGWWGAGQYTVSTQDIDWVAVATAGENYGIPVRPESANLSVSGSTPATSLSPSSGSLSLTAGTPLATKALAVYPSSASLTLTPGTPTVSDLQIIQPGTGQLQLSGQTPVVSTYIVANGDSDLFGLTGEASTGQQSGNGAGAFSLLESEGTTGAIGSSSFAQMTGEAVGLDGHAAAGLGSFYQMTSEGTTGAESDGTFFTLSGSGEIVLAHVSKGDGTFLSLSGEAAGEIHAYLYGSGRFGQLYGEGTTTKGHVSSGLGTFSLLTGASEGVKGHAADGEADLFLMTAEGVCFQRANLAGDADLFALEGDGAGSFSLYASDEYILYHRRPA